MNCRSIFIGLLLGSTLFAACEQKTEQVKQEVIEEADQSSQPQSSAPEVQQTTKIQFEESIHDFGRINKGDMVGHIFKFKNVGDAPLLIVDAKTSCGCTVPQWTKEPIKPGETGELEVKYNGSGSGKIHKTVTVLANTEPKETVLEIVADVKAIDMDDKGPLKK